MIEQIPLAENERTLIEEWLNAGLSTRADGERFVRTVKFNLWLCSQYGVEVSDKDLRRIVKWLIGEYYGEVEAFDPRKTADILECH